MTSPKSLSPPREFLELDARLECLEMLRAFYHEVYTIGFPHADERESLENLEEHLKQRDAGAYGRSNFHIVLLRENREVVGGCIFDYLAEPNCGVIEFLLCRATHRGRGVGTELLERTHEMLVGDALRAHARPLDFVLGEVRARAQSNPLVEDPDASARLRFWHRCGFRMLSFPYVQPPLAVDKSPVRNLMLIAKDFRESPGETMSSATLMSFLHEYMRLAMRIEQPFACPEFGEMSDFLNRQPQVALLPLIAE